MKSQHAVRVCVVLLSMLLLTASMTHATTYYVQQDGCAGCSDSNNCTQAQTESTGFVTVNKAATCSFPAGSEHVISIGNGEYQEQIRWSTAVSCTNGTCNLFPEGTSDANRVRIIGRSGHTAILKPLTGGGGVGIIDSSSSGSSRVSYVNIENLTIDATTCSGSPGVTQTCLAVDMKEAEHWKLLNNTFIGANVAAGGACVYVGHNSVDHLIQGNHFENCGRNRTNHALYISTHDVIAQDNTFYNSGGSAIVVYQSGEAAGDCHDNIVRRNRMRRNAFGDANPTSHVTLSCPRTLFYANEIVDSTSTASLGAISVKDPKTGAPNDDIDIDNNTIFSASGLGIAIHSTALRTRVRNNILHSTNGILDSGSQTTLSKNIGCTAAQGCDVTDVGGAKYNLTFVAPTTNLTLPAGSPAIGAGLDLTATVVLDRNQVPYVVPMTIGAHNSATVLPPNHLVFDITPVSGTLVGAAFNVQARVLDVLDAPVDLDAGSCILSKDAASGGSGTLAGCTLTVTPADGVCVWTGCTIDATGLYILDAALSGVTGADSAEFSIDAAPPGSAELRIQVIR